MSNNHNDPLNITVSKFRLIALRNNSSMKDQAINILATLEGVIKAAKPRGKDNITVKITRHEVKPKQEVGFVPRTKLLKPKKKVSRDEE